MDKVNVSLTKAQVSLLLDGLANELTNVEFKIKELEECGKPTRAKKEQFRELDELWNQFLKIHKNLEDNPEKQSSIKQENLTDSQKKMQQLRAKMEQKSQPEMTR